MADNENRFYTGAEPTAAQLPAGAPLSAGMAAESNNAGTNYHPAFMAPASPPVVNAATSPANYYAAAQHAATQPPVYYADDAIDYSSVAGKVTTAMAIGGLLGVSVAAGLRWLNGGDFELFPPAHRQPSENSFRVRNGDEQVPRGQQPVSSPAWNDARQHQASDNDDESSSSNSDESDDWGPQQSDRNALLTDQVQLLVSALHDSTRQQAQVTQQLATVAAAVSQHGTPETISLLLDIKRALADIQHDMAKSSNGEVNWQARLEAVIGKLNGCLDEMGMIAPTRQSLNAERDFGSSQTEPSGVTRLSDCAPTATPHVPESVDSEEAVSNALRCLLLENDPEPLAASVPLLYLYVANLHSQPKVPRYRKIYTSNESFQVIKALSGGAELLHAVGFIAANDDAKVLQWQGGQRAAHGEEANNDEEHYLRRLDEALAALKIIKTALAADATPKLSHILDDALAAMAATRSSSAATGTAPAPRRSSCTPPPPPASSETPKQTTNDENHMANVPKTPDVGSILSPPPTKKGPIFSPSSFPPQLLHNHMATTPGALLRDDATISFSDDSQLAGDHLLFGGNNHSPPSNNTNAARRELVPPSSPTDDDKDEDANNDTISEAVDAMWK